MMLRCTILFALLLCTLCAQDKKSAWDLFRERDYERALVALKKDSQLYPRTAAIIDGMGWCEYFLGRNDNAEKLFRESLAADPEYKWSKQGLELLGLTRAAPLQAAARLLSDADYQGARLAFQRIHDGKTAAGPECKGRASAGEGWCLYWLGQNDEAIKLFQRAWKEQPDLTDAQRGIGLCLYAKGENIKALDALRHVLKAEPTDYSSRLSAAWCLYLRKSYAEAEKEFRTALQQVPAGYGALSGLGWALEQQGNQAEALKCFEQAVVLSYDQFTTELRALAFGRADWKGLAFHAAMGAMRQRSDAAAKAELDYIVGQEPVAAKARLAHAVARLRCGEYDGALQEVEQARAQEGAVFIELSLALADGRSAPTHTDCDTVKGWALLALGRNDDAARMFLQAMSNNTNNVEATLGRGWALFATGAATEAAQAFQQALSALPLCTDAQSGLATVSAWRTAAYTTALQQSLTDPNATIAACDALLAANDGRYPADRLDLVHILRAQALRRLKRTDEAKDAYKAAVQRKPDSGGAHKGLMEIALAEGRTQDAISHAAGARTDAAFINDSEVLTVLADATFADRLIEPARKLYEEAITAGPTDAGALFAYALFEIDQKRIIEARLLLERAFAWNPSLAASVRARQTMESNAEFDKLHGVLGWSWLGRGKLAEAVTAFELSIAKDPREKEARRGLGLALLRLKKVKEANEALEKYVLGLQSDMRECPWGTLSTTLSEWGWALHEAGQWTQATQVFSRLATLHLGEKVVYADPYNGLGWCWLRLNRFDQAKKSFLDAISISPRYESALQGLEALQVLQLRSSK